MIFRQPNQVNRPGAPLASWKAPVRLAPVVAETFLTHRVEPNYPDEARHRHIQGPVVLGALVDEDGSVQQLKVISGDSQLASAAIDAVRRWKFKPYQSQGHRLQFETEITVNFALPNSAAAHN
jgi:protein TonB